MRSVACFDQPIAFLFSNRMRAYSINVAAIYENQNFLNEKNRNRSGASFEHRCKHTRLYVQASWEIGKYAMTVEAARHEGWRQLVRSDGDCA